MEKESKCMERITTYSTLAMSVFTAAGLIFLYVELMQFQNQGLMLEQSIRQTYKPLLVAESDTNNVHQSKIVFIKNKETNHYTLISTFILKNYGQGLLSFIGYLAMIDTNECDFRKSILEGKFSSLIVDKQYSYTRMSTLLPIEDKRIDFIVSNLGCENIILEYKYYIYILYFYKDQAGNLYDTEHLLVVPLDEAKIIGATSLPTIKKEVDGYSKETYHFYTDKERLRLISAIKQLKEPKDHPIAEILQK